MVSVSGADRSKKWKSTTEGQTQLVDQIIKNILGNYKYDYKVIGHFKGKTVYYNRILQHLFGMYHHLYLHIWKIILYFKHHKNG